MEVASIEASRVDAWLAATSLDDVRDAAYERLRRQRIVGVRRAY